MTSTTGIMRADDTEGQVRKFWSNKVRGMNPELVVREIIQGVMDFVPKKEVDYPLRGCFNKVNIDGYDRLSFYNNAPGMDEFEFEQFCHKLGWSSSREGKRDDSENHGIGVRTVCLKASPLGVRVYTRRNGGPIRFVEFYLDPVDGAPMYDGPHIVGDWATEEPMDTSVMKFNPPIADMNNGTQIVLMGSEDRKDTFNEPWDGHVDTAYNKDSWTSRIGQRYWGFDGVEVRMGKYGESNSYGQPWLGIGEYLWQEKWNPTGGKDGGPVHPNLLFNRTKVKDRTTGYTVHYFHIKTKSHQVWSGPSYMARKGSFGGVVCGGEVYNFINDADYRGIASRKMGIELVHEEVAIFVEVPKGKGHFTPKQDRADLQADYVLDLPEGRKLVSGKSVKLWHFGDVVRRNHPKWLKELIAKANARYTTEQSRDARRWLAELAKKLELELSSDLVVDDNGDLMAAEEEKLAITPDHPHNEGKRGENKPDAVREAGDRQKARTGPSLGLFRVAGMYVEDEELRGQVFHWKAFDTSEPMLVFNLNNKLVKKYIDPYRVKLGELDPVNWCEFNFESSIGRLMSGPAMRVFGAWFLGVKARYQAGKITSLEGPFGHETSAMNEGLWFDVVRGGLEDMLGSEVQRLVAQRKAELTVVPAAE